MLNFIWNISVVHAVIAVAIAFGLDTLTTYFALRGKGFVEVDPFTKLFISKIGLVLALLVPRYTFLGVLYILAHKGVVWPATLHKGGAL